MRYGYSNKFVRSYNCVCLFELVRVRRVSCDTCVLISACGRIRKFADLRVILLSYVCYFVCILYDFSITCTSCHSNMQLLLNASYRRRRAWIALQILNTITSGLLINVDLRIGEMKCAHFSHKLFYYNK